MENEASFIHESIPNDPILDTSVEVDMSHFDLDLDSILGAEQIIPPPQVDASAASFVQTDPEVPPQIEGIIEPERAPCAPTLPLLLSTPLTKADAEKGVQLTLKQGSTIHQPVITSILNEDHYQQELRIGRQKYDRLGSLLGTCGGFLHALIHPFEGLLGRRIPLGLAGGSAQEQQEKLPNPISNAHEPSWFLPGLDTTKASRPHLHQTKSTASGFFFQFFHDSIGPEQALLAPFYSPGK